MSHGKENPLTVKRRNAQPDRARMRSAQGGLHQKNNREHTNEVVRVRRQQKGRQDGIMAQMIDEARDPIEFTCENAIYSSDWHIPLQDEPLVKKLFTTAKEHDTQNLVIAGDLWDCDNVSKFTKTTLSEQVERFTFKGEIEEVRKMLKRVLNVFDQVWICRGNHEKRWCDLNAGTVGMKQLFDLARPGITDREWERRVHITLDDHMFMTMNGQRWMFCHPRNFRITPLSVVRDLSAKHLCNVIGGHGHQFNQGTDRSGQFITLDGGGLFDRHALEYARETSCHPTMRSGFYLLKDGRVYPFEGDEI